jgi:hypothetical protein
MRRIRVVGLALGFLGVASGCATSTGSTATTYPSPQSQVTRMSRAQQAAWRDSVYAQAIADVEGPRVSIRAEFSNVGGTRRARAFFDLEDDAYVLIGHIDADGVLRVVFPTQPADEGFVKGNRSYQTNEFYAGFVDQYQYRAQTFYRAAAIGRTDSYDGGLGYMFIIASWRPMRFERFQTEGRWDSFEMTDDEYLRDPRPAIYELASLLVGENREAYTVKFARYYNTQTVYGTNSALSSFRYCAGYQPLGFAWNPTNFVSSFNNFGFGSSLGGPGFYGYTFTRRGTTYTYDSFGDCYRTSPAGGFGYYTIPYRIASGPQNPPKRPFDPTSRQRPFTPRGFSAHPMPTPSDAKGSVPAVSANYRQRGLITTSDEPVVRGRREPRVEAPAPIASRARPSIQEMVTREPTTATDRGRAATDWSRTQQARTQTQDRERFSAPAPRERTYDQPSRSSGESHSAPPPSESRGGSSSASPRMSPPPAASPPASSSQGSRPAAPPPAASSSSSGSSSSGSSSSGSSGSSSSRPRP